MDLLQTAIYSQQDEDDNDRPEMQIVEQGFRLMISRSVENTPTVPLNLVFDEKIQPTDTDDFYLFPQYNQMGSL